MNAKEYKKAVKTLGKVNFALAVEWGRGSDQPETVADALRLMDARKNGKRYKTKKAQREAAETLRDVAAKVHARRVRTVIIAWANQNPGAVRRKNIKNYGNCGKRASIFGANAIPTLGTGNLRGRADKRIRQAVKQWMYHNCPDYSGSTHNTVSIGAAPDAYTNTFAGEQYSKSCTYRKTTAYHCVAIPQDYWQRVIRRGMVEVDGLLTLDLEPITHDSATVYAAKWVRVAGKRLKMESGYIALRDGQTAHAKSATGAVALLTRRENQARYSRLSRKIREKLESLRINGYGEVKVTLSDSYRAGNCTAGTLAFRDKHFPGRDFATVEEVLRVESQRGLAINACIQAIYREKDLAQN